MNRWYICLVVIGLSICSIGTTAYGLSVQLSVQDKDVDTDEFDLSGELTDELFESLHQKVQPDSDEPWRSIPWKISLLEAQRLAAHERKPIFVWAMDGHPLGCT